MSRRVSWLCAVLLLIASPGAAAGDWTACRTAVERAEQDAALPPGLLLAIARTESGRRDPATGRIEPWPWALNAAGMGMLAATRAEAVAAVTALQARGLRSIDVGCLQVNLLHHPDAFASLEDAFDPLANARYAARFLRQLHLRAVRGAGRSPGTIPPRRRAARPTGCACWPTSPARASPRRRRRPARPQPCAWRPACRCVGIRSPPCCPRPRCACRSSFHALSPPRG
ncbi:transglycosylase SLT domain-containing protein [Roseicella sp. GB24]|uniref:Transglycosylase SLT domain-containing protein n=1 Tax=Roseicella aerolata TaxID=2883479 RepID=A0A9X1I9N3_9PROT|nr:transglycosylase SLT domain-containing protein [Roseicella aerolata]